MSVHEGPPCCSYNSPSTSPWLLCRRFQWGSRVCETIYSINCSPHRCFVSDYVFFTSWVVDGNRLLIPSCIVWTTHVWLIDWFSAKIQENKSKKTLPADGIFGMAQLKNPRALRSRIWGQRHLAINGHAAAAPPLIQSSYSINKAFVHTKYKPHHLQLQTYSADHLVHIQKWIPKCVLVIGSWPTHKLVVMGQP